MSAKAHLHCVSDPADEGTTLKAVCGVDVPNAHFEFRFNIGSKFGGELFLALNRFNTCWKCLDGKLDKTYLYGIRSGQEARDEAA